MRATDCTSPATGLRIQRIPQPGTRAFTALVAFDAGARTERREENGVAHLLEHLVFRGGRTYDTLRALSGAAEAIGAVVGAETSHDLTIFYVTARAEAAAAAIDLLTDIAGRPRIDGDDVESTRQVVLRKIESAGEEPAIAAELLIGRAAFGDHPLGRPVLGEADRVRALTREAVLAFRSRRWRTGRSGAFLVGNLSHLPGEAELRELVGRLPAPGQDDGYEPAPAFAPQTLVDERDSHQSHLSLSYRVAMPVGDARARAALSVYTTLLGGSGASRLVSEIRDRRGLAYGVYAEEHASADVAAVQLSAGLESARCVEAYACMREIVDELRTRGPRADELERAKASTVGQRLLAFDETKAVAIHAAVQSVVFGQDTDPDRYLRALDAVTSEEVMAIARGVSQEPAVACVGPHTAGEFTAQTGSREPVRGPFA